MVVEGHGQVISDEILGRASHVHGIPEVEFIFEFVELLLGDFRVLGLVEFGTEEDVVICIDIKTLGLDTKRSCFLTIEVIFTLKMSSDCVVSHVNGGV